MSLYWRSSSSSCQYLGLDKSFLQVIKAWHNQTDVTSHDLRFPTMTHSSALVDEVSGEGEEGGVHPGERWICW